MTCRTQTPLNNSTRSNQITTYFCLQVPRQWRVRPRCARWKLLRAAAAPEPSSCFLCRTTLAVAGEDYCIVAASTRMSSGFDILTRQSSKMMNL